MGFFLFVLFVSLFVFLFKKNHSPVCSRKRLFDSELLFKNNGSHQVLLDFQTCRKFCIPFPDLGLDTTSWSVDQSFDFVAWFLSAVGHHIDRDVLFQGTVN